MTERPIDQQADGRTDSKGSSITMKLKKNKNKYFSFEMNEMGRGGGYAPEGIIWVLPQGLCTFAITVLRRSMNNVK